MGPQQELLLDELLVGADILEESSSFFGSELLRCFANSFESNWKSYYRLSDKEYLDRVLNHGDWTLQVNKSHPKTADVTVCREHILTLKRNDFREVAAVLSAILRPLKDLETSYQSVLLDQKILKFSQLYSSLLALADQQYETLEQIFEKKNHLSYKQIARAKADFYELEFVDLQDHQSTWHDIRSISESFARAVKIVPLEIKMDHAIIAVTDPPNLKDREQLEFALNRPLVFKIASSTQIENSIVERFGNSQRFLT